jgi:hypothetical protein
VPEPVYVVRSDGVLTCDLCGVVIHQDTTLLHAIWHQEND